MTICCERKKVAYVSPLCIYSMVEHHVGILLFCRDRNSGLIRSIGRMGISKIFIDRV